MLLSSPCKGSPLQQILYTGRHAAVNDKAVLVHEQGNFCHTHFQSINALICMHKLANPASAVQNVFEIAVTGSSCLADAVCQLPCFLCVASEGMRMPYRRPSIPVARLPVHWSAQAGIDQNHSWVQGGFGLLGCRHRLILNPPCLGV